MRNLKRAAAVGAALLASPMAASAADLRLVVTGVPNGNGAVMAALFDNQATFMQQPKARAGCKVKAASGTVTCVFHGLGPGHYAIAAFHDANGNGKLDRNSVGVPTEAYGFSNNAQGSGGPPTFGQAAFDWDGKAPISIALDD